MAGRHIPYYAVRNGNGFWEPRGRMRALGFQPCACGPDGPTAWERAKALNRQWQKVRLNQQDAPGLPQGGYVYFLQSGNRVKIGFSKNPFTRGAQHRTAMSAPVDLMIAVQATRQDERELHARLADYRVLGEWFAADEPVIAAMLSAALGRTKNETDSECLSGHQLGRSECPGISP